MQEVSKVSDLAELAEGVPRNPITVAVSEISAEEDQLLIPGISPLELDDVAQEKLSKFFGLPAGYINRCSPALRAANFNYWFQNSGEGLASFYSIGTTLTGISDPNKKSLPLVTYMDAIINAFDPDDDVTEFHHDGEYLHLDIVTVSSARVLGDGSQERPATTDVTRAGVRMIAYPDLDKPPVLSTYLLRDLGGEGLCIAEPSAKVTLRSKTIEDIAKDVQANLDYLRIQLGSRLEEYVQSAEQQVPGELSHFLYNMSTERGLSRNVTKRVMDLGSNQKNASVYDAAQIFAGVANESVNYSSRLKLQDIAGYLVGDTAHALDRCSQCLHPFLNYDNV